MLKITRSGTSITPDDPHSLPMRCGHCRHALSPTLATHDGRWPTKIQHAASRNPPAPTTDDSSISALNPLQQPTVVANHRKSSTVVMAQERSGIAVGLNKGHVRCPVSFLCCVCWSILGLGLDFSLRWSVQVESGGAGIR